MYIAVDIDNTIFVCIKKTFPLVGKVIPFAIETLKDLIKKGHKIILLSMRHKETIEPVLELLKGFGVEIYSVNSNKAGKFFSKSPKVYRHYTIDDNNVPNHLMEFEGEQVIDWLKLREDLKKLNLIE